MKEVNNCNIPFLVKRVVLQHLLSVANSFSYRL